nr:hypothetical protein [Cytophagales bacterium]
LLRIDNLNKTTRLRSTLAENRQQRLIVTLASVGLLLVSGLSYVLHRLNKLLRQKNRQVEDIADNLGKSNAEVKALSEDLEQKVIQRTERLEEQNVLLRKYAFYNAHKLRGPLARILGITHLVKMEQETISETEALTFIEQSAQEMDTVIREINNSLNDYTEQDDKEQ